MYTLFRSPFLVFIGLMLFTPSSIALGAPKAKLWERWTANDNKATKEIDHRAWDGFLAGNLRPVQGGVNRLDYARVSESDKNALERYVDLLSALPISTYNRDQQLAYWINLYNSLTVKVVLDHYPVKSILDIKISPGLFSFGPWGKKLLEVEGEWLSLNDIEHRILRPIWRDARVHYAVNCASLGCPNLRPRAFVADGLDATLTQSAREYINSDRGVRIDSRGRLYVSSIYHWFKEDFGNNDRGVIDHLKLYAEPELQLALADTKRVADDFYDWELNNVDSAQIVRKLRAGSRTRAQER